MIAFLAFPADVRKMIYTTNAIESLNAKLRRSHEAALSGLEPGQERLENVAQGMTLAKAQFAILFEDRFKLA